MHVVPCLLESTLLGQEGRGGSEEGVWEEEGVLDWKLSAGPISQAEELRLPELRAAARSKVAAPEHVHILIRQPDPPREPECITTDTCLNHISPDGQSEDASSTQEPGANRIRDSRAALPLQQ
ncbi:hypothetical protein NQZ68_008112 [Dissostichus eleginoides]|nr:hypothetical protein NQZ68_008112 [Dissostichus eleginoides]